MPEGKKIDRPKDNNGYFEKMIRSMFVVGFSRKVVDDKWEGFRSVFQNFDIDKVASWGEFDVLDAVERPEIVRNFKKIGATVSNAKALQEIIRENGDVHSYIRSLDDLDFDSRIKAISKKFQWFGPTSTKIFLYSSGEPIDH